MAGDDHDADARLEIEGDRAVILAVIASINVGSTVVDSYQIPVHPSVPAEELTLEAMADIGEEVVRQFTDTVPKEAVTGEQVVIEASDMEELVSLDVEGWGDADHD